MVRTRKKATFSSCNGSSRPRENVFYLIFVWISFFSFLFFFTFCILLSFFYYFIIIDLFFEICFFKEKNKAKKVSEEKMKIIDDSQPPYLPINASFTVLAVFLCSMAYSRRQMQ